MPSVSNENSFSCFLVAKKLKFWQKSLCNCINITNKIEIMNIIYALFMVRHCRPAAEIVHRNVMMMISVSQRHLQLLQYHQSNKHKMQLKRNNYQRSVPPTSPVVLVTSGIIGTKEIKVPAYESWSQRHQFFWSSNLVFKSRFQCKAAVLPSLLSPIFPQVPTANLPTPSFVDMST